MADTEGFDEVNKDITAQQTREIEKVLKQPVSVTREDWENRPTAALPKDEWTQWEDTIQAQVDKLINDSRTLRFATFAIGGGVVLALGVSALTSKALVGITQAIEQLGENQMHLANVIPVQGPLMPVVAQDIVAKANLNGSDPTVNPENVVGKPFSGPVTEASAEAKKGMAEDKASGIIEAAKGEEPV